LLDSFRSYATFLNDDWWIAGAPKQVRSIVDQLDASQPRSKSQLLIESLFDGNAGNSSVHPCLIRYWGPGVWPVPEEEDWFVVKYPDDSDFETMSRMVAEPGEHGLHFPIENPDDASAAIRILAWKPVQDHFGRLVLLFFQKDGCLRIKGAVFHGKPLENQ